jgi:SMI1/KNR4 family protein SUKH-1
VNPKEWLERFGFSPTEGPESPRRIEELERRISLKQLPGYRRILQVFQRERPSTSSSIHLPADYRGFLQETGGGDLRDVVVPCTVPTPFGEHNLTCLHSIREVIDLLDSKVAPRNMICIAYGHFGMTTCLSVAGPDEGKIFSLDTELRFFWDDKTLSNLPALDPTIKEFFRMRDANKLPERPRGYENCYHVADSFSEFLSKMHLASDSDD